MAARYRFAGDGERSRAGQFVGERDPSEGQVQGIEWYEVERRQLRLGLALLREPS
jgi:hypothetical protein